MIPLEESASDEEENGVEETVSSYDASMHPEVVDGELVIPSLDETSEMIIDEVWNPGM